MDTDKYIAYIKTDDKDIAKNVKFRFDTSDYKLDTLLSHGKNEKVIRLLKYKLGGKIMTKFVGLRA